MSDTSRRKLLKSIAAGSGAIVAGKSLPESWSRPVVDSVMLPAHAQTSETGPLCSTGPLTITNTSYGIVIIFDGISCSLAEYAETDCSFGVGCDPDTMLFVDFDTNNFDLPPPYGSNWDGTPDVNDLGPGVYSFTKTRTGGGNTGDYTVTFTVSFTGSSGSYSDMTVSNVSFVAF